MEQVILRDRARDYRQLLCYQKAEIIMVITKSFCEKHLRNDVATAQQLNMYAEDGVRLIREGAELASKSLLDEQARIEEAKQSLRQLRNKIYIMLKSNPKHPPCWTRKTPAFIDAWDFGRSHYSLEEFVAYAENRTGFETANFIAVLLEQADNLLYRLICSLEERKKEFEMKQKLKTAKVDLNVSGSDEEVVPNNNLHNPVEPVHIGLVGLGRACMQMHIPELQHYDKLFKITAGCDILADRLERFGQMFPEAKIYAHAEELFEDSNVDIVSIIVPSTLHLEYTEKALRAGKKVFLEKPIATNRVDLSRLRALNQVFPGKLFIRHNRHFEACYNHVLEIMNSGILGDVFEVKLRRHRHRFRDDWQTITELGGGQFFNWGPHLIEQALHLLGCDKIVSEWVDAKSIASRGDAEDHIKVLLKGENGRIIDLEISDSVPLPEAVITVYGTRGALISRDERTIQLQYLPADYAIPPKETRRQSPPVEGNFVYSSWEEPPWVREEIPVAPSNQYEMKRIYLALYEALSCAAAFPIKNEEAFRVMEMLLHLREVSGFAAK